MILIRKLLPVLLIWCVSFIITASSPDRDSWQQPERIMDSMGVKQGMVVGEIGAGRGYFTFKLSERVGSSGKIYANDIDKDVLDEIEERCLEENITNIITVLGKPDHPQFADSLLDMSVMMIAFHDFEEPVKMLVNLRKSLRKDARVFIIERDPDKWTQGRGHFLPEEKIIRLVREAGYNVEKVMKFLQRDNIYICTPGDIK